MELLGHKVERYHWRATDRDRFLSRCSKFDYVLTALPQDFSPDFWQAVKDRTLLVTWYFDWIRFWGREAQYLPALREFDLVLSTDGFDSSWYKQNGVHRAYLPHACDTRTFKPVESKDEYACDVAFVGHAYTDHRLDLLKELESRYDFRHYGQRSCVYGPDHATICNSAKVMVADNCVNVPGYWSDRVYLEVGSGGFLLHPRVEGIEKAFVDGRHLVLYEDPDDLFAKIDYYLAHEDERKAIAAEGWKHVHRRHSQKVRVKQFCGLVLSHIRTSRRA